MWPRTCSRPPFGGVRTRISCACKIVGEVASTWTAGLPRENYAGNTPKPQWARGVSLTTPGRLVSSGGLRQIDVLYARFAQFRCRPPFHDLQLGIPDRRAGDRQPRTSPAPFGRYDNPAATAGSTRSVSPHADPDAPQTPSRARTPGHRRNEDGQTDVRPSPEPRNRREKVGEEFVYGESGRHGEEGRDATSSI